MRTSFMVNEVFYSLQGEGVRAGMPNVFVRFTGCNLRCNGEEVAPGVMQPVCDTEFASGRKVNHAMLLDWIERESRGECKSIIFTGGEPGLQLDKSLVDFFKERGYYLAIETNGTQELPDGLDWITCSPKTAEHTLKLKRCTELKYVRAWGQGIPKPVIEAEYYLVSPHALPGGQLDPEAVKWCIDLVRKNPTWRMSCQLHKLWAVR